MNKIRDFKWIDPAVAEIKMRIKYLEVFAEIFVYLLVGVWHMWATAGYCQLCLYLTITYT